MTRTSTSPSPLRRRAIASLGSALLLLASYCPAPASAEDSTLLLGFGSCIAKEKTPLWSAVTAARPDVFLFLGDTIYQSKAELGNEAAIRLHYRRLFSEPDFRRLLLKTLAYATWDDHDFGGDNSDSSFTGRIASRNAFRELWPNNPPPPDGLAESVAFSVVSGPAEIIVPDGRTYRRNVPETKHGTLYGERQLQWIESRLRSPLKQVVVLASGTQWLSDAVVQKPEDYETLSRFPDEQARLLAAIDASPATVILLSGDRHFAEILELRLNTKSVYEISSSPLNAPTAGAPRIGTDARRKTLVADKHNFGLLDVRERDGEISVKAGIYGEHGEPLATAVLPTANR